MRRIRIHRRHQHQPPQVQTSIVHSRISAQAFRSRHHRHRSAMRSPQQIERRNSQPLDELQQTLCRSHAWNGRARPGDRRTPRPSCPARKPWHTAPEPAWYIARKKNIPATHAAKSAPAQNPRADSACAPHPYPSSTLPPPRPEAEQNAVETSGLHSTIAKSSNSQDNSFTARQILFR